MPFPYLDFNPIHSNFEEPNHSVFYFPSSSQNLFHITPQGFSNDRKFHQGPIRSLLSSNSSNFPPTTQRSSSNDNTSITAQASFEYSQQNTGLQFDIGNDQLFTSYRPQKHLESTLLPQKPSCSSVSTPSVTALRKNSSQSDVIEPYHPKSPLSTSSPKSKPILSIQTTIDEQNLDDKPRCFEHGCNGRRFSSVSNLMRHQREKKRLVKPACPRCGTTFTRITARRTHLQRGRCQRGDREPSDEK